MNATANSTGGGRKMAVLITLGLVVLALLAWGVSLLMGGKSEQAKKPPKITLVAPPPLPPPPPPKLEKKPDPPKEQKEVKVEQPTPKQETPPPSPELKMEGPAGNGPSAFAAGPVKNEDLSKIGTGKPGGDKVAAPVVAASNLFNPFTNYANLLKGEFQRYLSRNNDLRRRHYTVEVRVWVAGGGVLNRFELVGSAGDEETDDAIRKAFTALQSVSQAPPVNMPQPIRLRIATGA